MLRPATVAGIGELLWDIFPHHQQLGGAPANFAWHCWQLGAEAYPVSCVGTDSLGRRARSRLAEMGVDDRYVFTTDVLPTGSVEVSLSAAGKPSYEIKADVAWDQLPLADELKTLARRLDAICFGSLAQRSVPTRETIRAVLREMPADALKVFDVNLRQSFHSRALIEESLELASVLKLSDEELPVLAAHFALPGAEAAQLVSLRERFDLRLVVYTRGAEGSRLVGADGTSDFPGLGGLAVDSVGAGDSFTAAICMGILRGGSLERVNRFANEVAAYVCSQRGATPVLPAHLLKSQLLPSPPKR
ncbi:carbohydrate kinase family protein [Synoicihabitans lomoniglobus]|uniref:Carbohydrate kinase n=1 Tax=Synoicihabitans lomoniglobus TaxID=2909285 RepID=A0AAE9ZVE1_9BACT|nr:carbohydrate kinase [Opitutaceae bacterium LMO-M01]WED64091.1 carbohydrate kinase [Opitutaceae bacterium LMO-M01]